MCVYPILCVFHWTPFPSSPPAPPPSEAQLCARLCVCMCPCPRVRVRVRACVRVSLHPSPLTHRQTSGGHHLFAPLTDQRILPPSTEKCWGITFWNSACGTSLTWQSLWANTAPLSFSWANAGYLKGNSQSSRHQVRGNREFPEMSMTCWLAAKWIHGRGAKCLAFVSRFSGIRAFFCPRMDTYSTASRLFEAGKRMST